MDGEVVCATCRLEHRGIASIAPGSDVATVQPRDDIASKGSELQLLVGKGSDRRQAPGSSKSLPGLAVAGRRASFADKKLVAGNVKQQRAPYRTAD